MQDYLPSLILPLDIVYKSSMNSGFLFLFWSQNCLENGQSLSAILECSIIFFSRLSCVFQLSCIWPVSYILYFVTYLVSWLHSFLHVLYSLDPSTLMCLILSQFLCICPYYPVFNWWNQSNSIWILSNRVVTRN